MYYRAPPSSSAKLTSLWSLKADCFLIGGVPEVVVVMVTCEGYLDGLAGGGCVTVGGGKLFVKTKGCSHPRLSGSIQKIDWISVCTFSPAGN